MKNFLKISLINILIVFFVLIIAEFCAFVIEMKVLYDEGCFQEKTISKNITKIARHYHNIVSGWNNEPYQKDSLRKPEKTTQEEQNIYILGCSFAYGHQLKKEQTLQYKLAKQTKMNVFNFAVSSTGPREMLHILRNKEFLNKNNLIGGDFAEYFIYIIIGDHYRRLIYDLNEHAPHYKKTNNNDLILLKNKFFYCSYLYRQLKLLQYNYMKEEEIKNLFNLYIEKINKEIKQDFKNSKNQPTDLIIIDWGANITLPENLKKQGVKVITLQELTEIDLNNTEYHISDKDTHPNEKAWNIIVPALVKKLGL